MKKKRNRCVEKSSIVFEYHKSGTSVTNRVSDCVFEKTIKKTKKGTLFENNQKMFPRTCLEKLNEKQQLEKACL